MPSRKKRDQMATKYYIVRANDETRDKHTAGDQGGGFESYAEAAEAIDNMIETDPEFGSVDDWDVINGD